MSVTNFEGRPAFCISITDFPESASKLTQSMIVCNRAKRLLGLVLIRSVNLRLDYNSFTNGNILGHFSTRRGHLLEEGFAGWVEICDSLVSDGTVPVCHHSFFKPILSVILVTS